MSAQARSETAIGNPGARRVDMKLEVVVIPVSDVDRAKQFYGGLGWRLDADFAMDDAFRVVQFTPPGSPCSIKFGTGVTSAAPGSAQGLYLIVSDIEAARADARRARCRGQRGVPRRRRCIPPRRPTKAARAAPIRRGAATARSPRSAIRTAMAGCSRRSPRGCPAGWTRTPRHSPPRPSLRPRCGVRRPRTASTRSGPASMTRTGRTGTPSTSSGSRPARSCRHEQRLRRHRHRRRLAGRALRRRAGGGRPARRARRARAGRRRVLLLGVHPVQDAAAPGGGGAWRERRGGDSAGRCRGGAGLARLHGLELLRRRPGALARQAWHRPASRSRPAGRDGRGGGRRRSPRRRARGPGDRLGADHPARAGPARPRGRLDEPRGRPA